MDILSTGSAGSEHARAPRHRDGTHFVMAGSGEAVRDAVQRMITSGWQLLSEPVEATDDVWSMWVVAPG